MGNFLIRLQHTSLYNRHFNKLEFEDVLKFTLALATNPTLCQMLFTSSPYT